MAGPTLRLLVVKTHSPDKLLAFYQALGIGFTEEKHGNGPLHYAGSLGDLVLEIYPLANDAVADSTTRLGFAVSDLDSLLDKLRADGTVVRDTPWGRRTVVRDPDGRNVELYQA